MLTLQEYAKLSELVYENYATILINEAMPDRFDDILEYETDHVKAIVCVDLDSKEATVVFRGFRWYPGSLLRLLSFKPGEKKVHPKLLDDYFSISEDLLTALDNVRDACPVINATGHSWGGALAVLLGTQIRLGSLVTFAQPRIGSGKLLKQSLTTKDYLRVVNFGDVLTFLPSGFGYGHCGDVLGMRNPNAYEDFAFENPSKVERFLHHLSALSWGNVQRNHTIKEYQHRLNRLPRVPR